MNNFGSGVGNNLGIKKELFNFADGLRVPEDKHAVRGTLINTSAVMKFSFKDCETSPPLLAVQLRQ